MLARFLLHLLPLLTPAAVAASIPDSEGKVKHNGRFTFYPLKTKLAGPCDLEHGPDGALWGQDILVNLIFRVDPITGHVNEYPIPFTTPLNNQTIPGINNPLVKDRTALSCAIRKGADGNLYAGNGLRNQLVRINPRTKAIKVFDIPPQDPAGNLFNFNDLYTAKDGIWFTQTTGNVFTFFAFRDEKFTSVPIPTPGAIPLGCYVDSNGIVYIAELVGNKILTYNPKTKALAEHPLPVPGQFPAVIRAERNGWVYFSMFIGNGIGRINQKNPNKIELYHTNQTAFLGSEDTIDKYGGVWMSSFTTDVMARLDTNTFKYSYVPFPKTLASFGSIGNLGTALGGLIGNGIFGDVPPVVDIAVNYGPGDKIWFTSVLYNAVGSYTLTGLYK